MIVEIIIVPEDENHETYAIRDQSGHHLGDSESRVEAISIATQIAREHHLHRIILALDPH